MSEAYLDLGGGLRSTQRAWVRLKCPTCSTTVLALAGPETPAVFCPRRKCALALLRIARDR
jgi:hypothetical protein